jgi:glycosyltransferase involved in cell wall biosynthesis
VRLLGFRTDALSLMWAADIFVLPSLAEPFGLVLLEAMSLGKPVVATSAGGPLEIVLAGETGLLVPPAQPHELALAINQLLADPEKAIEMGRKGLERYKERFTTERMARETVAVYRKVTEYSG